MPAPLTSTPITLPLPLLHGAAGVWDEIGMVIGIVSLVSLLGFMAWSNGNKRRRERLLRRRRRILAQRERAERTGEGVDPDEHSDIADDIDEPDEPSHITATATTTASPQPASAPSPPPPLPKSSA